MKQYKAFCFDLDGTVFRGNSPIDAAVSLIKRLQDEKKHYFLVTNNSSKTPEQIKEKLLQMGLDVPLERIYSSAYITARYITKQYPNAEVHFIGSVGLYEALLSENLKITTEEHADVVVMGIDRTITYEKLSKATLALQNGAVLIGTNEDMKFPTEKGFVPGNGSFVKLVANVAGVKPIFIGKPSPIMLESIQEQYGFAKDEMVMIGDNYDTDILSGIRFGCDTIHVNTGVTKKEDVEKKELQPTYIVNSLDELSF